VIKQFFPEVINLLISFGLFILIWIVQILHYPFFKYISEKEFSLAMKDHTQHITIIVFPLMIAEIVLGFFLFYQYQNLYYSLCLLLILTIWVSTFFIQVPIHNKLLSGKDDALIKKLIRTNYVRTFLWSFKFILLASMCIS
jgi:hypothetical protein